MIDRLSPLDQGRDQVIDPLQLLRGSPDSASGFFEFTLIYVVCPVGRIVRVYKLAIVFFLTSVTNVRWFFELTAVL